jgi:hypothetical protein
LPRRVPGPLVCARPPVELAVAASLDLWRVADELANGAAPYGAVSSPLTLQRVARSKSPRDHASDVDALAHRMLAQVCPRRR